MGDVDLYDQLISYYRVFIKSKNELFTFLMYQLLIYGYNTLLFVNL